MDWKNLLKLDIQDFIKTHENQDVSTLALQGSPDQSWQWALILDQIKARQKARGKIPLWPTHHPDIIFPAPNVLEQASSAATARYKAALVKGKSFADLTGGVGVDACALSEHFESGICAERDEVTAGLLAHNLPLLTDKPVGIFHGTAEDFIKDMDPVDLIMIDPQRREGQRKGIFKLEECSPDVTTLLPGLLDKAGHVMIKTSPMLDIDQGIRQLSHVHSVHILEWDGDCKELVYVLGVRADLSPEDVPITAVNLDDEGNVLKQITFTRKEEQSAQEAISAPLKYLFEPSPAFQKSGCFHRICEVFGVKKLHPHTHLYTAEQPCPGFPGRHFDILDLYAANAKKLPITKGNLAIRNFPDSAESLKKRLKLSDGGDDYLFACTLDGGRKALIHCRKSESLEN